MMYSFNSAIRGSSALVASTVLAIVGLLSGPSPTANAQDNPNSNNLPALFIVGDSTASNGRDLGWGSHPGKYFEATKIRVFNRARGGRSSRTFQKEGLWDRVLAEMKAGDFVLIQFGHNDGGEPGEGKDRGSLRGLGEETCEIEYPDGSKETVHTFGWYMQKYVADTRNQGATPIILSLTVRNIWNDGRIERGSGHYRRWAEEVARSAGAAFVDLTQIIADEYERLGREKVAAFFPRDHTHTSAEGADLNARLVVAGLKALASRPLNGFLSEAGRSIAAASPEFTLPPRPRAGTQTSFPTPGTLSDNYDPDLPALFIIGDSTVKNGGDDGAQGLWGWGNPIAVYFDQTKINVENEALGGTSSRTYRTAGHWDNVLALVKPGDFVIMQFGHNDGGAINDRRRARGTIQGNGDETREIDNLLTGKHEVVHSYGWYLRQYIADTQAKGATPIVCSLIPRNDWTDGKVHRADNAYAKWAAEAAREGGAAFIDLNQIIADHYDQMGEAAVKPFFPREHTHTGWEGAAFNARCVVEGILALEERPLKSFLARTSEQ